MATSSVPRRRCSGEDYSHERVFLTIRTAEPLVMSCPICGATERPIATDVVEGAYPQRTDVDVRELETYGFPRSRLKLVSPIHDFQGDNDD